MNISKFNIDPYNALKALLEVTSPYLGESFLKVVCHELQKLFDADLVLITDAMNCNPTTKVKILYATNPSLPDSFELEGTPCKPYFIASSSSSEKGTGSIIFNLIIPFDLNSYSSRSSFIRFAYALRYVSSWVKLSEK